MDDQLYYLLNITNGTNGTDEFHKEFYLILNLAVGGNWPGYPDGTTNFPADFVVDYIRVYKDQAELTIDELGVSNLNVYPNPTTDILTLEGINGMTSLNYTIYSLNGEKLAESALKDQNSIDVSYLTIGMYILEIKNDDGITKRITFSKN
jgi:beta-glucanase (GH16 family)